MSNTELNAVAKVILIAIRAGGTGKTHTATHYAFYCHTIKNRRVCFIEFDGQLNGADLLLASEYGYELNINSDSLFSNEPLPLPNIQEGIAVIKPKNKNFDIIDRQSNELISNVKNNIEKLKAHFDMIVIDTPPSSLLRVNAAMVVSDYIVSPLEINNKSINGVRDHVEKIKATKQNFNPNLKFLGMVFNKFDSRIEVDKRLLGIFLKQFGSLVFKTVMKDRKAPYKTALMEAKPVWDLKTSSAREAAKEIFSVFEELESKMEA
tara:strand:+ start:2770 stop:3561 length:792 start_codon:yes stop_codon:yes gene_type:complete